MQNNLYGFHIIENIGHLEQYPKVLMICFVVYEQLRCMLLFTGFLAIPRKYCRGLGYFSISMQICSCSKHYLQIPIILALRMFIKIIFIQIPGLLFTKLY